MRTVGVLGGMGPLASAAFIDRLVTLTAADRDQDHVPVVLLSWPEVPDRTAFILGRGPDPRPAMIDGARRLKTAGAELLVIPCNTANVWIDEVASAAGLEPIDWLGTTIRSLEERGVRRAGLLATNGSVRAGTYQRLLASSGIDCVVPDAATQTLIMEAIYSLKAGRLTDETRHRVAAIAEGMGDAGVDVVVLGCTELPLVLRGTATMVSTIDPADVVAKTAIQLAGGRTRDV